MRVRPWAGAGLALLATTSACGLFEATQEEQLQAVAKDWCMMIRASQVIPVYPLTEGLQPGDVFLESATIHDQRAMYEARGFLPLPMLVTRLAGTRQSYGAFYDAAYFDAAYGRRPAPRWVDAAAGSNATAAMPLAVPRASFPSYSFDVSRSQGLKLAVPIQSVPVGLGLLNASHATGSLLLRDAYTYGLAGDDLLRKLVGWAGDDRVQANLKAMAEQSPQHPLFLRIVSRVFIARSVDVTIEATGSSAAGADAGKTAPVDLLDPTATAKSPDAFAAKQALGESLAGLEVGGSIRLAAAYGRSVTMTETFQRPLVIGYLGFDVPIAKTGELGAPVATLDFLEARTPTDPNAEAIKTLAKQRDLYDLQDQLEQALAAATDRNGVNEIIALVQEVCDLSALAGDPNLPSLRQTADGLMATAPGRLDELRRTVETDLLQPLFIFLTVATVGPDGKIDGAKYDAIQATIRRFPSLRTR